MELRIVLHCVYTSWNDFDCTQIFICFQYTTIVYYQC